MSTTASPLPADPVFDRCWWIYALCRERFFADHTETIVQALHPLLESGTPVQLLEVGCGPGFYSRRLAARFPQLQVMGVDTSERLLCRARAQARRAHLGNCCFFKGDAQHLDKCLAVADAVIASRLFLILARRNEVMRAIYETLRPGGIFFMAEPTSPLRTAIPLWLMRGMDRLAGQAHVCAGKVECTVLSAATFQELVGSQPWEEVHYRCDGRYQYALCRKCA